MIALVFLVLGGIFVGGLLKGLIEMLNYTMKGDGSDFKNLVNIFKWPIISFVLLILFISFVLPRVDS